jgi:hypothetical protein
MDRDPEVTRFIVGPWADPVAHRAFVEARIHAVYPTGMGYWSVFASDRFVGWILLTPLGVTDYPPVDLSFGRRLADVMHTLAYQSLPTSMSDPVFGMKSLSAAMRYTTHGRRLIR